MHSKILAFTLFAFLFASCEKAQELFRDAADKDDGSQRFPEPGGEVRDDLSALVQRTDDGVTFRRDLDYPTDINGSIRIESKLKDMRTVIITALGREDETINEKTSTEIDFSKSSGKFSLTTKRLGRPLVEQKKEDGTSIKIKPHEKENQTLKFIVQSDQWAIRKNNQETDLALYMWADSLVPAMQEILTHCGAYPRNTWFSSSRTWKPGDELTLTGHSVKLLNPFKATGRVTLRYGGEKAIDGHPCGVFTVRGEISVKEQIDFEGQKHDAEIAISKGKIWASLLHPILLREEYDTVQSISSGQHGGTQIHRQGNIHLTIQREWKPTSKKKE